VFPRRVSIVQVKALTGDIKTLTAKLLRLEGGR
jgi:hypothetical protein